MTTFISSIKMAFAEEDKRFNNKLIDIKTINRNMLVNIDPITMDTDYFYKYENLEFYFKIFTIIPKVYFVNIDYLGVFTGKIITKTIYSKSRTIIKKYMEFVKNGKKVHFFIYESYDELNGGEYNIKHIITTLYYIRPQPITTYEMKNQIINNKYAHMCNMFYHKEIENLVNKNTLLYFGDNFYSSVV